MKSDEICLFINLKPKQRNLVEPLFIHREECAGTVLFEQGDKADCLYVVIEGEVEIKYKPEDGPELVVTRVRPENVVGWSAALGNPNYTSSAVCSANSSLLCVNGDDLRKLCEQYPDICPIILDRLATMIAKRLQNTHSHVIELLKHGLNIPAGTTLPAEVVQEET